MKFFNRAGPIRPEDHYHLNPLERFDFENFLFLIEEKNYFVKSDGLVKTQTAPFADRLRCWGVPAGKSRNWSKIQEHRS